MRILQHLKNLLRSTEVLESINAGIDHQQRLLDDRLDRVIELQKMLLDNQRVELANQRQQIELMQEFLKRAGAREQIRFQALVENQNAQIAFQRAQIEMIGEVLKEAIAGAPEQTRAMLQRMQGASAETQADKTG